MLHYVHHLEKTSLEKRVGLFVLCAGGLLLVILILVGSRQTLFGNYQVRTTLGNGLGLKEGTPVHLIGMEIGRVDSISLNARNEINVIMSIRKKYRDRIKKDSVTRLVPIDFLGHSALEISTGSPGASSAQAGSILKSVPVIGTSDGAGNSMPVFAKADRVMESVVALIQGLSTPLERMDNILQRFDAMSKSISEGRGSLGALVHDPTLYHKVTGILEQTQDVMEKMDKTTANIQEASKKLPETMENGGASVAEIRKGIQGIPGLMRGWSKLIASVDKSSEKVYELLRRGENHMNEVDEILKTIKEVSGNIPDMAKSTQKNIDEIARIIEGAEKNWVVRGLIEKEKTDRPILIEARD